MSSAPPASSPEIRYTFEDKPAPLVAEDESPLQMRFKRSTDLVYVLDHDLTVVWVSPSMERILGYSHSELVGTHLSDLRFISPQSIEKSFSDIPRILKGEGVAASRYLFFAKDGSPRVADVSGTPLIRSGKVAGAVCVARNGTGKSSRASEQRRQRRHTDGLAEKMAVLGRLGRLIGQTDDLDLVYERFAAEVQKLVPFHSMAINLRDHHNGNGNGHGCAFGIDGHERTVSHYALPLTGTLSESVMQTRTGLLFNPQDDNDLVALFPTLSSASAAGIRSMISVPMIFRDKAVGVLHLHSRTPNAYDANDFRMAELIAAHISGAVAGAGLSGRLRKAEETLRASEERYRTLLEQEAVGLAEFEIGTGRFVKAGRQLGRMLGRTEAELQNTTVHAITHPEDLPAHTDKMRRLMAGEFSHYSLEQRSLRKGGEAIWTALHVSRLGPDGRSPGRMLALIQDISELKQSTRENERLVRQSSILHETCLDIISEQQREPILAAIAKRALDLIGGDRCNVYLHNPERDLLERVASAGSQPGPGPETAGRGEGAVGQAWSTRAIVRSGDHAARTPAGSSDTPRPAGAFVAVPVLHGQDFLGVVEIIANPPHRFTRSDEKLLAMFALQAAIAIVNARLRDMIDKDLEERKRMESEHKAIQAQLLQSQKMEAIGTLAGGIAHDFNNILMGIQGHISLIQMNLAPNHPHFSLLRGIEEQIASGASLTTQLLGFAREGKYEVKPTNLNMVLTNTSEIFSRTHKEICVSRSLQEGLWAAEVDRRQIEQVLLNLFINSWQAMPEGGDLYLETQNVTLGEQEVKPYGVPAGRYVKMSVTDTGTGMDEATKTRIFEPFFTTKRPGKGNGLGLASVYGIMNNHGGFITVWSEPGKGASFNLYLPASQKSFIDEELPVEKHVLTGTETILVVDDEKSNVTVMREILESFGYRVLVAGSGQEAVAVYMEKGQEIDLVILDMIMPGMGGGKVFDALRSMNPEVKVILASGYSKDGEARQILDRGCSGFVQKPFRIASIAALIREVIEK